MVFKKLKFAAAADLLHVKFVEFRDAFSKQFFVGASSLPAEEIL